VTVQNATGSGVIIQSGTSSYVYSTGAGVEEVISSGIFIPSGVITMWSGSIATIPFGWNLCDGTNGTPNLTDKFVVAAGATYAVAATGGSADAVVVSHTHGATSTDSGHQHNQNQRSASHFGSTAGLAAGGSFPGQPELNYAPDGRNTSLASANITTSIASTGVSGTNANLPPYFALAYIMKL